MLKTTLLSATAIFISGLLHAQEGTHLAFDGVNDYVKVNNTFNPITSSYTKEAKIMTNGTATNRDIISGDIYSQHAFWISDNKLAAGHNGQAGGDWDYVIDQDMMYPNVWYHVAVTYDAPTKTMKLYRNGTLVDTQTNVPHFSNNASAGALYVGSYYGGTFFNGAIDEVRLWSRVLTAEEIENNMNCELGTGQTGLVLHYNFNNGTGGADNTGLYTVEDSSGNSLDASVYGFALNGTTSNWVSGSPVVSGVACEALVGSHVFKDVALKVYPNPCRDILYIENNGTQAQITITDINGRELVTQQLYAQTSQVSIKNLPSGMYFMAYTGGDFVKTVKFIKE